MNDTYSKQPRPAATPAPKPIGEVEVEINDLKMATEQLEKLMRELSARITPILHVMDVKPGNEANPQRQITAPLALVIRERRDHVEDITRLARELVIRVEL